MNETIHCFDLNPFFFFFHKRQFEAKLDISALYASTDRKIDAFEFLESTGSVLEEVSDEELKDVKLQFEFDPTRYNVEDLYGKTQYSDDLPGK